MEHLPVEAHSSGVTGDRQCLVAPLQEVRWQRLCERMHCGDSPAERNSSIEETSSRRASSCLKEGAKARMESLARAPQLREVGQSSMGLSFIGRIEELNELQREGRRAPTSISFVRI